MKLFLIESDKADYEQIKRMIVCANNSDNATCIAESEFNDTNESLGIKRK